MTKTLKKVAVYLTEWHMLKIYATIMTISFLAIWVPTMAIALKNMFVFWYNFIF